MSPTVRGVLRAALAAGLGLGLALLYAWVIAPVQYTDTAPRTLRDDYRNDYLLLIARAYAADGNLERARTRLVLAAEGDPARTAAAAAQRLAAAGAGPEAVQALAALAADLDGQAGGLAAAPSPSPVVATRTGAATTGPTATAGPGATHTAEPTATLPTPTPPDTATLTPAPTETPRPTITPRQLPTRTPTPTPLGAFLFASQQQVCDPALTEPLIQVVTQDRSGEEIGGAEVIVEWAEGFDHFFTGLKPELGAGYGDFAMQPGVEYTVHLAESPGALVGPLVAETCTGASGEQFPGAWRLVWRQP